MLSKADYEVIARAFKKSREAVPQGASYGAVNIVDGVILDMAAALRANNGRFDKKRFLRACGWADAKIAVLGED